MSRIHLQAGNLNVNIKSYLITIWDVEITQYENYYRFKKNIITKRHK